MSIHEHYMRHALSLAKRNSGLTQENPSVGCVLVKDKIIIGRGVTGGLTTPKSRPHAEAIALKQAYEQIDQSDIMGATAYVTLEPCAHYGQTPPCAQALIDAQIHTIYIATQDPDIRVQGKGIQMLKDAQIMVHLGLLEDEARQHHAPFFTNLQHKRPYYTLKFAASLDGRVNYAPDMQRKKISSNLAHQQAHRLRMQHDGIAVGIGTIIADNPRLNCRLNGLSHHSPDIIIFDRQCRIDAQSLVFEPQKHAPNRRIFIFHAPDTTPKFHLEHVFYAPIADNFSEINKFLYEKKIYSVLIEGGPTLHTTFLNHKLVDRIIPFSGNMIIGAQAQAAFGALSQPIFLD